MSEFKTVNSNYFIFLFLILLLLFLLFSFWGLRVRVNMTSQSQGHMSHGKAKKVLEEWYHTVLQTQPLRVGQVNESYIRLTQENSIENSIQDCLPYILIPSSLCKLFLVYCKQPCVYHKVNTCCTCCIISSLYVPYDLWLCHLMWPAVWWHDLVTLTLIPKF